MFNQIQVALGLFVTTTELPLRNASTGHDSSSFNCTFDTACHWLSVGGTADHWKLAKGEPDQLLWLTATGTMQLPEAPFALIEIRGQQADQLASDLIQCQDVSSTLSFTYWAIGEADLEICLTDPEGKKFKCTGMLHAKTMPGKVSLKIPPTERPFRYTDSPETTSVADLVFPWTEVHFYMLQLSLFWTITEFSVVIVALRNRRSERIRYRSNTTGNTTEPPFDLLIIGRWALIQKGNTIFTIFLSHILLSHLFLVLQGDAMFVSDPLKCQTGTGKLLFRHWSNGPTSIQACAMLYGLNNAKIECVMPSPQEHNQDDATLLMFDLLKNIDEPFTVASLNRYLVIDEIAYIGKCDSSKTDMMTNISTMGPSIISTTTQSSLAATTFAQYIRVPHHLELTQGKGSIVKAVSSEALLVRSYHVNSAKILDMGSDDGFWETP
uniref:MAM domain-containing protein n=1 Tax=Parascaris equorum TaxID=6256 RepID=A0A914R4N3_PAREQ